MNGSGANHVPFGPSLSAGLTCSLLRRLQRFTSVDHTINPSPRPPSGWPSQPPLTIQLPLLELRCPESFAPRCCRRRASQWGTCGRTQGDLRLFEDHNRICDFVSHYENKERWNFYYGHEFAG